MSLKSLTTRHDTTGIRQKRSLKACIDRHGTTAKSRKGRVTVVMRWHGTAAKAQEWSLKSCKMRAAPQRQLKSGVAQVDMCARRHSENSRVESQESQNKQGTTARAQEW